MSHVVITGGNTPGGSAPNRFEINNLIQNKDQYSLYIQALSKPPFELYLPLSGLIDFQTDAMFTTSQSKPLSHFAIGGIHGLPYHQWEGSGGSHPVSGSQWGGYCTHGSVLFPTWHRPYVALYEVSIFSRSLTLPQY